MRKEILWAIIGGGLVGLIIAFGIWRANAALQSSRSPNATPAPSAIPTRELGITLAKPSDKDVVTDSPQTFSGITEPDAWVVLSTDTDDYIFQAGSDGSFSRDIKLNPGVNQIVLTAFKEDGSSASTNLLLVYSSEFAKETQSSTQNTSTSEADIRQRVIQKVEEVLKNPKAYLGSVTDIAGDTIQIKNDTSEIQQISISQNDITVMKLGKVNKEIKLTDVAIGDFIVALGFRNGNDVLDGRRILVTDPLTPLGIESLYVSVSKVEKKDIIVSPLRGGQQTTVSVDKNTDINKIKGAKVVGINLSAIDEGDTVIAVISKDSGIARSILVIASPSPAPSPS